jgi:leader peptidase (prepilin peptidase)/N-methyltransferase
VGPRWGSVELLSALLCGGIALAFGASFQTIGFTAMAVVGVALGVIDLQSFRLPTKLIAISTALLLASLLAAAATSGAWVPLRSGMLGAAGLSAAFLLLAVIRPGQLGLGDVKLAVPLGLLLGWFGWPFVVFGGCLAFLLSAATILVLLALGKLTLRSSVPFGPFMLAGTVVALLL